jgi:SAM-dependent methyltransferase
MDMGLAATENWKGERMYWDLASEDDRQLHLSRYVFARDTFQPGWKCLDAACGSGYGAAFLADKLRSVEGIDVDPGAIGYSQATYKKPNLNYRCADLQSTLPFQEATFDSITSFETLEHVSNQAKMISEFHRVLKPGGILVISTPDREVSERLGLDNHFHVAELSKTEFVRLLSPSFVIEGIYGQGNGTRVAAHWRAVHRFLRFGTRVLGMSVRTRIESALAKPFRRLRTHFYQMSSTPIQTATCADETAFIYMIAMARKLDGVNR